MTTYKSHCIKTDFKPVCVRCAKSALTTMEDVCSDCRAAEDWDRMVQKYPESCFPISKEHPEGI